MIDRFIKTLLLVIAICLVALVWWGALMFGYIEIVKLKIEIVWALLTVIGSFFVGFAEGFKSAVH